MCWLVSCQDRDTGSDGGHLSALPNLTCPSGGAASTLSGQLLKLGLLWMDAGNGLSLDVQKQPRGLECSPGLTSRPGLY